MATQFVVSVVLLPAKSGRVRRSQAMVAAISRDNKLPLYHQLYGILRDSIAHGEWQPGDTDPPGIGSGRVVRRQPYDGAPGA